MAMRMALSLVTGLASEKGSEMDLVQLELRRVLAMA